MKPQNFTTEVSEKKNIRSSKNSVNSVVASSPGEFPLKEITKHIICSIEVHSTLGHGLLENVYEEALSHEFNLREIEYE
ncbi:MAG: GxxExxY protein, partial [Nitrospirae bacterium]|nr:GxxExxY protein [Nitrospirota bacterium]